MVEQLTERNEARRAALLAAAGRFDATLVAMPEGAFLREVDGRSPRDIVAHLIGWNNCAAEVREAVARGALPASLTDPGRDFANTNARAMATYAARDKGTLRAQLRDSLAVWEALLRELPAAEWDESNGVRLGDWSVSNGALVEALTEEYDHHREELERWPI